MRAGNRATEHGSVRATAEPPSDAVPWGPSRTSFGRRLHPGSVGDPGDQDVLEVTHAQELLYWLFWRSREEERVQWEEVD